MIICSAIQFQNIKNGNIFTLCGRRHKTIYYQMTSMGFQPGKDYKAVCEGFINHKGDFLDRYDAFIHALEAGQISQTTKERKAEQHESELYSEDIY